MCLKKGVQCITFLQSLMHQVDNMFQVQNMVDETSEERRKQHKNIICYIILYIIHVIASQKGGIES